MPNNWKIYKLGEVINSANTGLDAIKRAPIVEDNTGIKCLRIQDVSQRKAFKDWGFCEVTQNNYEKFSLNKDEIIIARTGNTIGVNMFIEENLKSVFNNGLIRLRVNKDLCFPKYVYYNFRNKRFVDYINGIAYGTSTQPNMQINSLLSFEFLVPSLEEQHSIASILSAIDDKIENNLAINKTLEEMAMALYKHWFVDFGPFQDGEFVESELGRIPKGWEVKRLDEICNITIGRTPPRKEPQWFSQNEGVKWISIKDLGNSGIYISETSEYLTEEAIKKFNVPVIKPNTVLLSFKLTVGRVAISNERMLSNEAIAHLNRKDNNLPVEYLYSYLKSFDYNSLGSTSSIATAVNTQTIKAMKIIIPDTNQLEDYFEKVNSIFEQIKICQSENQTLTQLRDTVLPKLVSGEVRLKEFQES